MIMSDFINIDVCCLYVRECRKFIELLMIILIEDGELVE